MTSVIFEEKVDIVTSDYNNVNLYFGITFSFWSLLSLLKLSNVTSRRKPGMSRGELRCPPH